MPEWNEEFLTGLASGNPEPAVEQAEGYEPREPGTDGVPSFADWLTTNGSRTRQEWDRVNNSAQRYADSADANSGPGGSDPQPATRETSAPLGSSPMNV